MNYFRVGGVCLLLLIIAAALPSVWAQAPQTAGQGERSAVGIAPVVNEDLFSKGSGQGEAVSPESLMKRSSELKPVKVPDGTASLQSTSAPIKTESAAAAVREPAATSGQQTETAQAASEPVATEPAAAEPEPPAVPEGTAAATQESPAASASPAEPAVAETPGVPLVTQQAPTQEVTNTTPAEENVTPPENISAPANITPSENVSAPENVTAPENQSQNETVAENETETEQTAAGTEETPEDFTNRIWSEDRSPLEYYWDPKTFSGFFYDFDNDVGTERLEISLHKSGGNASRTIDSGDLKYNSTAQDIDYEFSDWGQYRVIGFMAEKYFAGYRANGVIDSDRSLLNEGQLRKVLTDSDTENTITSGSVLALEEGYELRIKEIDINGNKVYMALAKDGEEIDSKVINPSGLSSATYQYKEEIGGEDTPIIMAHISNVFASAETDLVTVDGLFQISDTYASVESDDKYGEMKVTNVDDTQIEMENEDSLSLRKNKIVNIFGDVGFQVADADILRFAPIVQRTGTFEVRGTVIDPSKVSEFTWTPYNFEGFFYDIDDDVGSESLTAEITGTTKIEDQNLVYDTKPQSVRFEFDDWGRYDVIGFMADKYFAGYNDDTKFTDVASVIGEGQLRKVLLDSDTEKTISTGSTLSLEEGYELRIKQVDINGNKVYLSLAKDDEEVDSKVVTPSSAADSSANYMYKIKIGSEDVPIIVAHIQSVFRGTEADLATVDALFQVSDTPESVDEGEIHGKMKVDSLSEDGITMKNDGSITLSRGKTVDIMDNIKFVVADSSERIFAPVAEKTVGGKPLSLNFSTAIVNRTVTISVTSDNKAVSGAQVTVAGNNIGSTDTAGEISYTPNNLGTLNVVAKKTGYNDATAKIQVMTPEAASRVAANETAANVLVLDAPTEVQKKGNFLITVTTGFNRTPVDGANLFFDEESIGMTNAQGTLTYATNLTGDHIIRATKEGYDNVTRKVTVLSPIVVQNITVPEKASTGQTVKISAAVSNIGSESDSRDLQLSVNGTPVENRTVTLGPMKNSTEVFNYKTKDPGAYRVSLDGQTRIMNVEKSQSNSALIALILVLLIAIGAGYYLYQTGELENLRRRLQGH